MPHGEFSTTGRLELARPARLPPNPIRIPNLTPHLSSQKLNHLGNALAMDGDFGRPSNMLLTRAILACILAGMLRVSRESKRKGTAPRDPERTRKRLLNAAFQEIHLSGFRSADMHAILAQAGVTKGALYHHFDSKEALGYAIVDEVLADIARDKWLHPLRNPANPVDALVRIVQSTSVKPQDLQRGCALNNLAQEMSPIDEGFRKRTARLFKLWHDAIAKALRTGQKQGAVRSNVDPDEAATFLIAAYEGYFSLAKNSQDARVLRSGLKSLTGYLEGLRAR